MTFRQAHDYITYDPESQRIVVWDAKYSQNGNFPSGLTIPVDKVAAWSDWVANAVSSYSGPSVSWCSVWRERTPVGGIAGCTANCSC